MTDGPQGSGGINVWERLRRRKVVQWGFAYSAGAWGLLQGLSYSIATFQWPQILQPLATLALLTGLPIVVVIAWYHGDKGRQRVTAAELTIIRLLFLLGGGMFWQYQRSVSDRGNDASAQAGATAGSNGSATRAAIDDAPANARFPACSGLRMGSVELQPQCVRPLAGCQGHARADAVRQRQVRQAAAHLRHQRIHGWSRDRDGCKFTDKAAPRIWDNPAWVFPKPTVCPAI